MFFIFCTNFRHNKPFISSIYQYVVNQLIAWQDAYLKRIEEMKGDFYALMQG